MRARAAALAALVVGALLAATGCAASVDPASNGRILAVGAETQYKSVIAQLGGKYVDARSVMSNPNTDPHSFEASAQVAATVSGAKLVVQNGLGYDSFMEKIEAASPGQGRIVISAQNVLGLPDGTKNPHLWYDPRTMPVVAKRVAQALTTLQPAHSAYFAANLARFNKSVAKWTAAIAAFRSAHPGITVATTEPIADDLLDAIGAGNLTPWALQAAIMNDTDPSPQDVAIQHTLFTDHRVSVFVYNRQVTDAITADYLRLAKANDIPVVAVYETMPASASTYQAWMEAELTALDKAVTAGTSTAGL